MFKLKKYTFINTWSTHMTSFHTNLDFFPSAAFLASKEPLMVKTHSTPSLMATCSAGWQTTSSG